MASEKPRYELFGVDEQTFHKEKHRRVELEAIKRLGKYVLRHVSDPGSDDFAYDCAVKAVQVKQSSLFKKVVLEAKGIDEKDTFRFSKTFNRFGFITIKLLTPTSATTLSETDIEVGYLLMEATHDPYDTDLKAYIESQKPQEVKTMSKELIKV